MKGLFRDLRVNKHRWTKTLWQLLVNHVLMYRLRLYKKTHHINHPIVHYYTVCWNEEKILPLVFDYYDRFVDKFIIYDNHSTDRSKSIIASHKNARIVEFQSEGFNDIVQNEIKNNCWKTSRGHADLVIVCDMDEFLYHTNLPLYLQNMLSARTSLPEIEGYNMYSTFFPDKHRLISEQVKNGIRDDAYSKKIIFDPHRIVEMRYSPGSHRAEPVGILRKGENSAKLLHYKNLGLDYLTDRYNILSKRLSETNKQEGLGVHYTYPIAQVEQNYARGVALSRNVIPKLSIILPTLNSAETLTTALASIHEQTFTDWEVIIMDGGSTDDTIEIVENFKEPRFIVYKEKDSGIYDAMNHGIVRSQGEWLYFIGCDDYLLEPDSLANALAEPLNADMIYCEVESDYLNEKYLGEWNYENLGYNRSHQGIFYRRHVFDIIGLYPTQYRVCADHYVNLAVFLNANLVTSYRPINVAYHTHGGFSANTEDYLFESEVDYLIARWGQNTLPKPILLKHCLQALRHHRSLSQRLWLLITLLRCKRSLH